MKKIIRLKDFLKRVADRDVNKLSSDYKADNLSKKQLGLMLDVATFLYGKRKFTKEQLEPFINQAGIWFVLEKLKRGGLVRIDNKGVPHRTRLGQQVARYIEKKELNTKNPKKMVKGK